MNVWEGSFYRHTGSHFYLGQQREMRARFDISSLECIHASLAYAVVLLRDEKRILKDIAETFEQQIRKLKKLLFNDLKTV